MDTTFCNESSIELQFMNSSEFFAQQSLLFGEGM